ncbi:MAG: hypothetical protein ABIV94_01480 [Acidimicrobiales bacterium]
MPDPLSAGHLVDDDVRAALGVIERAQAALAEGIDIGVATADLCDELDGVGAQLAALAGDTIDNLGTARYLLPWRDHLASHILAARALNDLQVHADVQVELLGRGLAEVADAASATLRGGTVITPRPPPAPALVR